MSPGPSHPPSRVPAPAQRGFSLLEVLVAVTVLSFGVLGVVALQAASLQANKQAKYQSSAARLARELGELMHTNFTVASVNNATSNPYLQSQLVAPNLPTAAQDCSSVACTSATAMASFDMRDWVSRVQAELPGAVVTTCFDTAPYDANGIPQWACTAGTGAVLAIKIGWTRDLFNRSTAGSAAVDQASTPGIVMPVIP